MSYTLIKKHTTRNYTNKNTSKHYIVIHYTGNKTDSAAGNANYFKSTYRGVSAHFFVDDSTVYEVVDPDKVAWAVGKNYGSNNLFNTVKNSNSIQIEMCSKGGKITDATYANTVALTKSLMKQYGISASHVYRHYDVCSKLCPGWTGWVGKDTSIWQRFKRDIGSASSTPASTPSTPSKPASTPSTSTSSGSYTVKITADTLNVRSGPGTGYKVTTQVHKGGIYTIVSTQGGWGKLKSGAGWISLSYTSKVSGGGSTSSSSASSTYKVKVTASTLNVRSGPGTGYKVTAKIHKGEVYTITETKSGWGKLKSGAGWISLDYAKRV